MYTKEIENLSSERDNALEKIKKLKKNKLFLWKFKREPGQIQILSGNKCRNLWLPLWLSSMRKRHWSCKKKKKKKKTEQGRHKITTEHSLWKPGWPGLLRNNCSLYFQKVD